MSSSSEITAELLKFIDSAPTPFHAVDSAMSLLKKAHFQELTEWSPWHLQVGESYFIQRNYSSLIAFRVPRGPIRSLRIIGAHTDSPNLRLKPNPEYVKEGYRQLGVEVYGGALLNSWLDRDLGVAGRIHYQKEGHLFSHLVQIHEPICRVPQLAIHLDRNVNDGLKLNKQKHLPPIFALEAGTKDEAEKNALLDRVLDEIGLTKKQMLSFELQLYALEESRVGGANGEFIFAPRLDNLAMCHSALSALAATEGGDEVLNIAVLFDHEEVGSDSSQGAGSPFLPDTIERIMLAMGLSRDEYLRSLPDSIFISADMAHAIHPNYTDRHDENHKPRINQGPVIKINSNQRYATDSHSSAFFEFLCSQVDVPVQKFINRTDLACGSTIGPMTAASLGIRTVDVGNPMLSMHSAREMAGSQDPEYILKAFSKFYE